MSYILDALRKSDQQRRRGAPPTLLAARTAPVEARRQALLRYGLFALVLVGAGIAIGLMRPWQRERDIPVVAATKPPDQGVNPTGKTPQGEVTGTEPRIPPLAPLVPPEPAASPPADTARSSAAAPQTATKAQKKVKPGKARRNTGAGFAKTDPARGSASGSEKTVAPGSDQAMTAAESAPVETAVPIAELPMAIQKELPAMSIMVHAYSDDPAKRLVGINNHLLHEGEEVAPGLKLEQITLDGMILSFRGYRFRRGAR